MTASSLVRDPALPGRRPGRWGAALRAIAIIWYRDVLRFSRDRPRFLVALVMPVLYLVVLGTGLAASLPGGFGAPGLSYLEYLYPGVVGMTVLMSSLSGAISIAMDREFGFLKEILVAPVPGWAIAAGKALGAATQALAQGLLIVVLGPLAGVALTPASAAALLAVIVVLAFALSSLGVLVSTRMRSMQAFQVAMNLLTMPLFFLSGSLFLLNGLPSWMAVLTRLDPAAYGVDALRRIVLGAGGLPAGTADRLALTLFGAVVPVPAEVAILAVFGALALGLAARSFAVRR